ncbi:MAG: hypothetical protein KY432_02360 [Acidobacteria bacterium]|nr:hypothetical protein [Acidobacteriota bacterium]
MLEKLTVDDFKPLTGEAFVLTEQGIELQLERVMPVMESERARLSRQPFSLIFRGPSTPHLPQRIYSLEHRSFTEPLEIFLVPVGHSRDGLEYEAVFS